MLTRDAAEDHRASYLPDIAGEIDGDEPQGDEYREASRRCLSFMRRAFNFIHEARSPDEHRIRFWVVSSALEHPACEGKTDSQLADMCATTRANFSKHKLAFERQNNLPPTLSQKSVGARNSYRAARIDQLT